MWGRFVTTFEEDMQLMVKEARAKFNLRITVSNYRGNPAQAIPHPLGDAAQFARYRPTSPCLQWRLGCCNARGSACPAIACLCGLHWPGWTARDSWLG